MQKTLRGVIFDLDGTLITPVLDFAHLRKMLCEASSLFEDRSRDLLDTLQLLSPTTKRRAEKIISDFEDQGRKLFSFQPGAVQLLRLLEKKNLLRAVITRNSSASLDQLRQEMERHDLHHADMIFLGREFVPFKPDPAPALHVLQKKWGLSEGQHDEVWFVGDGEHDLLCAHRAKCVPVLILNKGDHDPKHVAHQKHLEQLGLHKLAFDDLISLTKEIEKRL